VLQDGEFTKLGSNRRQAVDVRVLAATNRDLDAMMLAGDFREDLYYRLKVIEVTVPALRERLDEIPRLTDFFVTKYARKYNRPVPSISDELRQLLLAHDWPGNIRELENMIKRLVILQDEQLVIRELRQLSARAPQFAMAGASPIALAADAASYAQAPPAAAPLPPPPLPEETEVAAPPAAAEESRSLAEVARAASLKAERAAIERTLDQVRWNRRKAAQLLGVSYKTLLNKIKECGISQK